MYLFRCNEIRRPTATKAINFFGQEPAHKPNTERSTKHRTLPDIKCGCLIRCRRKNTEQFRVARTVWFASEEV